ncbi:putative meiotically up-regulated protein [Erysiphe necator]|uniref:Putative meiotically up-regulated protein n=1 Tax=Uncinula necator TaxID=52586 RepID=A0A0B1P5E3_UNCNE|nr:putative meiotically up-regulated protein [Erysiphe necator]
MSCRRRSNSRYYCGKNSTLNDSQSLDILDESRRKGEKKSKVPAKGLYKSKRIVIDPVTGDEIQIEDNMELIESKKDFRFLTPTSNIYRKNLTLKISSNQANEKCRKINVPLPSPMKSDFKLDMPIHGKKTNALFHPIYSFDLEPIFKKFEKSTNIVCITIVISVIVFGKLAGGALYGLIFISLCITSVIFLWMKNIVQKSRSYKLQDKNKRGEYATAGIFPESVEWINSFLGVIWGLIDPEKFSSLADLLEDVMQASATGIIENARVTEINQGSNPIRILSLTALPASHIKKFKDYIRSHGKDDKKPEEIKPNEDSDGAFFNLECSFAYNALVKNKNMYMQIVFDIGIKGLFGIPFPVFVELQELVGIMRLRIQVSPEPPLLKTLTFTLMGLPKVQVSCIPMIQVGINVLNLPIISKFINESIVTVVNKYVAPRSITLDIGRILNGDDIQKEVETVGVLWIIIHKVFGLSNQDRRGSDRGGPDSYITISFSKYGKPMYSTRVIQDDLNPIWEESCPLLINPALIKVDEQLSIDLWDCDRSTPDDQIGRVELSLQKMIKNSGKMYHLISRLQSLSLGCSIPGELYWEIGYFRKSNLSFSLRTEEINIKPTDESKNSKELQDEKRMLDRATEEVPACTPPDPLWSSGICSIIVHKIVNLELQKINGSSGKRKDRDYEPALKSGDMEQEEHKNLASSYCTILINDELVYRTRTKNESSKPIFNTSTDRFIRDWHSAIITIVVRDQRIREHDPILGVVSLKVSDLLQNCSQVTRWYPLTGGIGHGHIRVSLLFRSFEIVLPPKQLGWDVGTFEITSTTILATGYERISKLKMRTCGSSGRIPRSLCQKSEIEDSVFWDISRTKEKNYVRLPVKYRYRSPIVFEFHVAKKVKADAYSVIWLHNIEDNAEVKISIPIWKTNNGMRLTQNYVTKENCQDIPDLYVEEIGQLAFTARFKPGIDHDHRKSISDNESRETQETWEACYSENLRKSNTQKSHIGPVHEGAKDRKQLTKYAIHSTGVRSNYSIRNDCIPGPSERISYISGSSSDSNSDNGDLGLDENDTLNPHDDNLSYGQYDDEVAHNEAYQATHSRNPLKQILKYSENKDNLHRKHRGLMQWKPIRNLEFAKDETKYLFHRTLRKASLQEK